jgi:hypothetical protein
MRALFAIFTRLRAVKLCLKGTNKREQQKGRRERRPLAASL